MSRSFENRISLAALLIGVGEIMLRLMSDVIAECIKENI